MPRRRPEGNAETARCQVPVTPDPASCDRGVERHNLGARSATGGRRKVIVRSPRGGDQGAGSTTSRRGTSRSGSRGTKIPGETVARTKGSGAKAAGSCGQHKFTVQ